MKRAIPPRLTRGEKTLLGRTADFVRMYVACVSIAGPTLSVWFATVKTNAEVRAFQMPPEIPTTATYGTIAGIYLPIFAAVAAYVWATRAFPEREAAPHGFRMALFRDAFTLVVVTVVLMLPPVLYLWPGKIQTANTFLVWYQTVVATAVGGAFTYYFHASIGPRAARRRGPSPADLSAAGPANAGGAPLVSGTDGPRTARRVRRSPRRSARGGRGETTE